MKLWEILVPASGAIAWTLYVQWRSRSRPLKAPARPSEPALVLDPAPDRPVPFGYKIAWLACRAPDPRRVCEDLGIADLEPANWRSGMAAAYAGGTFVSPAVKGWVFVVSARLPEVADAGDPDRLAQWLSGLATHLDGVCYFATDRVVENHVWARVARGGVPRVFGYSGERGEVLASLGAPTPEEISLGCPLAASPSGPVDPATPVPDEESVLAVAGAWSVDPRDLPSLSTEAGSGWLTRSWPAAA